MGWLKDLLGRLKNKIEFYYPHTPMKLPK
jgi:hypothetical protein